MVCALCGAPFRWLCRAVGSDLRERYARLGRSATCALPMRTPSYAGRVGGQTPGSCAARLAHCPCDCSARSPGCQHLTISAAVPLFGATTISALHFSDDPRLGALLSVPDAWRLTLARLPPASVFAVAFAALVRSPPVQAATAVTRGLSRSLASQQAALFLPCPLRSTRSI